MAFKFTGKNILVTGASKGIGRGLAQALSKAGAEVYAVARTKDLLDSLAEECENIKPVELDIGDWNKTREVVQALPTFDGVVNNAAILYPTCPAVDTTEKEIDETFSVNVKAAVNIAQIVAKKMISEKRKGSIVNISSVNGISALPEVLAYDMSKAALDMMTKQFALELARHNIRVNSVNPTLVMTPMTQKEFCGTEKGEYIKNRIPMRRCVEIEEVVNVVMHLLSDYSSAVTGTMNPVDGGLLCHY